MFVQNFRTWISTSFNLRNKFHLYEIQISTAEINNSTVLYWKYQYCIIPCTQHCGIVLWLHFTTTFIVHTLLIMKQLNKQWEVVFYHEIMVTSLQYVCYSIMYHHTTWKLTLYSQSPIDHTLFNKYIIYYIQESCNFSEYQNSTLNLKICKK